MKKWIAIFVAIVFSLGIGLQAIPVQAASTGQWVLTGKEIHWVEPYGPDVKTYPADIPWNKTFTSSDGVFSTTYTGGEFNVTRTHTFAKNSESKTDTWSAPPPTINGGEKYKFTMESKGSAGNGMGISNMSGYMDPPSGWQLAFRGDGNVTKEFVAPPAPKSGKEKRVIAVNLSSGASGVGTENGVTYMYVYEWKTVAAEIKSIKVSPNPLILSDKSPIKLKVTAVYTDGTTSDITNDSDTEYDIDDNDVATVSDAGIVNIGNGAANGESAIITISNGENEVTVHVAISLQSIKSIKSSTASVVLSSVEGKNYKQLKITAKLKSGKTENVTSKALYTSDNTSITVNEKGMLMVAVGTVKGTKGTVTVSYGGKTCKINLRIK